MGLVAPTFWLVYLPLAAVPVAVFFLNMLPQSRLAAGRSDAAEVAEATLLLAYEQRLRDARTWPCNTAMLRTLFFSVLLSIAMSLLQKLWSRLFF